MVEFPINNNYRIILLTLELMSLAFFMEIAFFFFRKFYKNKKNEYSKNIELAWAIMFISYAIAWIFYIIGDYYGYRQINLLLGYLSLSVGGMIFTYQIESNKLLNTKYGFTIFAISVFFILINSYIFFPSWIQIIASMAALPGLGIIFIYFYVLIRKIWNTYKISSIGLISGIASWIIGYIGTTDAAVSLFGGLYIRVIADILTLIGLAILGISLNIIPSVDEFLWRDKIKYIILTTKWGILLYNENFKEKRELNEFLLSGALAAVEEFIKDTLDRDSGLKVVSKGDEYYLIEQGDYVVGVFIVKEELEILKTYLRRIIREFESFFKKQLKKWTGNIEIFAPTKDLIRNIVQ
ncbi:MAG: hypothetical protein GF329_16960 [Candidatus Lokiarchaeota archaeon]|nr:hypothetical protein [Candidatus Lokiarchaeota archaeon]